MRRERFRCVRMIYVEAEGNTPILAQRIHEAAREGRQPTKEGPIPRIQLIRILIWAPRTSIRAATSMPLMPAKVAASASPAVPVEELLCSLPKAATFEADARPDVRAGYRHFILHQ